MNKILSGVWEDEQKDLFPSYELREGPYRIHTYVEEPLASSLLPTCHLFILLQTHKLTYLLKAPSGEVIRIKSYESTGVLSRDMFFRFVLEKEALLKQVYLDVDVIQLEGMFAFVPEDLHHPSSYGTLGRLFFGEELFEDEVHHYRQPGGDFYCLMPLPPALRHLLKHYLHPHRIQHVVSSVWNVYSPGPPTEPFIILVLQRQEFILLLKKGEELLFGNRYPYFSAQDVLYFLQAVRKIHLSETTNCEVLTLGDSPHIPAHTDWSAYGFFIRRLKPRHSHPPKWVQVPQGDLWYQIVFGDRLS